MMRRRIALLLTLLIAGKLAACGGSGDPVEAAAHEAMTRDGIGDAAITQRVEGNPDVQGADELYCVATDVTTQDGQLPYLLVVWRTGDEWQARQLPEGYYEWDLQGCPR